MRPGNSSEKQLFQLISRDAQFTHICGKEQEIILKNISLKPSSVHWCSPWNFGVGCWRRQKGQTPWTTITWDWRSAHSPQAFRKYRLHRRLTGSRCLRDKVPLAQKQHRWFSTRPLARDLRECSLCYELLFSTVLYWLHFTWIAFLRYRQCYIVAGSTLPELFFSTLMQWKSQARECSSSSILIWPSYFTWKIPTPLKSTG